MTVRSVLVTGSSDGLGLAAAKDLIARGWDVTLHARSQDRATHASHSAPGAHDVVVADFSFFAEVRAMAGLLNQRAPFDTVIHNAAVGSGEARKITTVDGHAHVLQINALSPFLLTSLLQPAQRMVWVSSGLHRSGSTKLDDVDWDRRTWDGYQAYSDSKLFDATLSAAFARLRPDKVSNTLEPGWVPTKMGGLGAPDDLELGHLTQVWLAEATDPGAQGTGGYFRHQRTGRAHPAAADEKFQTELLSLFKQLTGQ